MPWLLSLLLWIPASLVVGRHLFLSDPTTVQFSSVSSTLTAVLGFLLVTFGFVVSWIWALCLLIAGLTVLNNYSVGMAIANVIALLIIVFGIAFLVAFVLASALRRGG